MLASCSPKELKHDTQLMQLSSWMAGSFNSAEQAQLDTNYFHINLEMARIWPDRQDAVWLYVEQATAWSMDRPYRQRVYRLSRLESGKLESVVYTLEAPLRFAGAWKSTDSFNSLTPDSLVERTGCAIELIQEGDAFVGSTIGEGCESVLRGASYATSMVRVEETVLTSWDRGYNENNEQVWGAVAGPYIFKKKYDD